MERIQVDEQKYGIPLLSGFLGLMIGWLIFGFFLNGITLAVVCIVIALVALGGGYVVTTKRRR
jgi:hypothetical protein